MEESRILLLEKIGLPYSEMEAEGIMIPVLGVNCEYKQPARFEETILIDVSVKEYSGVKISMQYKITNKESGNILVIGETKHCFTDSNLKPISLKKVKPNMHEKFLELIN